MIDASIWNKLVTKKSRLGIIMSWPHIPSGWTLDFFWMFIQMARLPNVLKKSILYIQIYNSREFNL